MSQAWKKIGDINKFIDGVDFRTVEYNRITNKIQPNQTITKISIAKYPDERLGITVIDHTGRLQTKFSEFSNIGDNPYQYHLTTANHKLFLHILEEIDNIADLGDILPDLVRTLEIKISKEDLFADLENMANNRAFTFEEVINEAEILERRGVSGALAHLASFYYEKDNNHLAAWQIYQILAQIDPQVESIITNLEYIIKNDLTTGFAVLINALTAENNQLRQQLGQPVKGKNLHSESHDHSKVPEDDRTMTRK